MAAIEFSGKEIHSRVQQAVPEVSENYVLNLINEALIDLGQYNLKTEYAKTSAQVIAITFKAGSVQDVVELLSFPNVSLSVLFVQLVVTPDII